MPAAFKLGDGAATPASITLERRGVQYRLRKFFSTTNGFVLLDAPNGRC
jgi:hypothetical protein